MRLNFFGRWWGVFVWFGLVWCCGSNLESHICEAKAIFPSFISLTPVLNHYCCFVFHVKNTNCVQRQWHINKVTYFLYWTCVPSQVPWYRRMWINRMQWLWSCVTFRKVPWFIALTQFYTLIMLISSIQCDYYRVHEKNALSSYMILYKWNSAYKLFRLSCWKI